MRVWAGVVNQLETQSLDTSMADNIEWVWVDSAQQKRVVSQCNNAEKLPFIKGTAPVEKGLCRK